MIYKITIKLIALSLLVTGVIIIFGCCVFLYDVSVGQDSMRPTFYWALTYNILKIVAGIALLRYRKWGIYLLYGILLCDILYWLFSGYYHILFLKFMTPEFDVVAKVLAVLVVFQKRLLFPLGLTLFFLLPQTRKVFAEAEEARSPVKGPFD